MESIISINEERILEECRKHVEEGEFRGKLVLKEEDAGQWSWRRNNKH